MKVKLACTSDAFHRLHQAADTKRGLAPRVLKADLKLLLLDHSAMIRHIGKDNLEGDT